MPKAKLKQMSKSFLFLSVDNDLQTTGSLAKEWCRPLPETGNTESCFNVLQNPFYIDVVVALPRPFHADAAPSSWSLFTHTGLANLLKFTLWIFELLLRIICALRMSRLTRL